MNFIPAHIVPPDEHVALKHNVEAVLSSQQATIDRLIKMLSIWKNTDHKTATEGTYSLLKLETNELISNTGVSDEWNRE